MSVIINLPPTPDLLNWLLTLAAIASLSLLTFTSKKTHLIFKPPSVSPSSSSSVLVSPCLLSVLHYSTTRAPVLQSQHPAGLQTFGLVLGKPVGHASKGEYSSCTSGLSMKFTDVRSQSFLNRTHEKSGKQGKTIVPLYIQVGI